MGLIVMVSAALRFHDIGGLSLWYDEVVTMRLALEDTPAALLKLLIETDATRAPLHPLLLQPWVRVFGPSETSGRSFSAICGLLTVVLIYRIGREAYDARTGLWAAALASISPLLVQYSREVRMYAWLTLLTCLAWWLLLSFRREAPPWKQILYPVTLVALAYSHPLGVLMVGALGLGYLASARAFWLPGTRWLGLQLIVLAAIAPWIGFFLDHPPEFLSGRLSPRFLLGLPIGFIGGNSVTLAGLAGLVAWGLVTRDRDRTRRLVLDQPTAAKSMLIWLVVPPSVLYLYSLAGHPVFGPARYSLFVGPAYLLLLARGLVKLTPFLRPWVALGVLVMASMQLRATVYAPDLKADWRAVASYLDFWESQPTIIVVVSADPTRNVEVETARYYLGMRARVLTPEALGDPGLKSLQSWPRRGWSLYVAVGTRGGQLASQVPFELGANYVLGSSRRESFPGLRLMDALPKRARPSFPP